MILDRLSILTDEVSADFSEALEWCVRRGLRHVELRVIDGANVARLSDAQVDRVRRETAARGLAVSAIASPLFKCALDPSRPVPSGDSFGNPEEDVEAHFSRLPRTIEIARRLGAPGIRIFSFWREKDPERHRPEVVRHLKRAAEIAAREKSLLLLENETACNGGFAAEVAAFVREVGRPEALRALWDPGNEVYGGRSAFPEGYAHVKDLLAHVHLKDVRLDAEGRPTCLPFGDGTVPLAAQIRALEKDGYRGLYTLEPRLDRKGAETSLERLRALLRNEELA